MRNDTPKIFENIKDTLIFLSIFLILVIFCSIPRFARAGLILAHPNYTGINSGLVGYWSFDGPDMAGNIAYDRSGNSNNGTLTNGPTRIGGKLGQSLSFDGVNDCVMTGTTGNNSVKGLSQFTISQWVKFNTIGVGQIFYDERQGVAFGRLSMGFYVAAGNRIEVDLTPWDTGVAAPVFIQSPTNSVSANTWYHVVFVFNANTGTHHLYLNNVDTVSASSTVAFANTSPAYPIKIGAQGGSSGCITPTNGLIDDVRIYNRALTADEIKRLYKIGEAAKIGVSANNNSLANGLVGYWSFDNTDMAGNIAYDRSGQNNNGTLTNGPTRTIGKIGQALSFDGSNDYVNVGSPLSSPDTWTYAVWFYPNTISANFSGLIGQGNNPRVTFNSNVLNRVVQGFVEWSEAPGYMGIDSSPVTLNAWHHAVFTVDTIAQTMKLYVDGSLANSRSWSLGTVTKPSTTHYLNRRDGGDTFNGSMDDARIYSRALTADEIKRLYKIGEAAKIGVSANNNSLANGLVGYWSFDNTDMAGNIAYDRSGNSNNGTLTNGPTRAIGKLGQALSFDGTDDYVDAGNGNSLNFATSDFSISGWIKGTVAQEDIIIGKQAGAASKWAVSLTDDSEKEGRIRMSISDGVTPKLIYGPTVVSDNTWHHFVVVGKRDASMVIYTDNSAGIAVNISAVGDIDDEAETVRIGDINTGTLNFPGLVDDVRIYNRALSTDEIKRLYNLGR